MLQKTCLHTFHRKSVPWKLDVGMHLVYYYLYYSCLNTFWPYCPYLSLHFFYTCIHMVSRVTSTFSQLLHKPQQPQQRQSNRSLQRIYTTSAAMCVCVCVCVCVREREIERDLLIYCFNIIVLYLTNTSITSHDLTSFDQERLCHDMLVQSYLVQTLMHSY